MRIATLAPEPDAESDHDRELAAPRHRRTDVILQRDRRQAAEGEPAVEVQRAEKTAGDEAGKHRQRKGVAHAGLVERARAAAIGNLHRGAEHERPDHDAEGHRCDRAAEFGMRREQRDRDSHREADRDKLGQQSGRITLADPDAPAGRKAKRDAGQHRAEANADKEQKALPQSDQPRDRKPREQGRQ